MSLPYELLANLSKAVQPLVFETNIEDFPYSVSGTAFIVGYEGRPYVLTARHSLKPETLCPVCIFPSDTSQYIVPLKDVFFVHKDDASEDFADLAVISIDVSHVTAEVGQATLIDLARASNEWISDSKHAEFVIIGYPADYSFVDYESQILHSNRVILHAKYLNPSVSPHLHEIAISEPYELTTFSGFSGSPVFSWTPRLDNPTTPVFCGMAIRGSSQSGRIHFLDRSVLLDALKVKRAYELAEIS